MALQDIIAAIIAKTDADIEAARSAQQKEISALREECERDISGKKQEIEKQKEEKKVRLLAKANAHAETEKRNAVLNKKRELLDRLYARVLDELCNTSEKEVEPLLRALLKSIESKGTIRPSSAHAAMLKKLAPSEQFTLGKEVDARGGFVFESEKAEQDCTFEHLVSEVLRPETELASASSLFA